tara:strand:+ start:548 stop:1615 length:1068 start_codon:yes stop_codon:yes gene_type:complete
MTCKKNRTIREKILECLDDKIKNIHPALREKLLVELKVLPEANNVVKCKSYVVKLLGIPEMGRHTREYWTSRGWSESESYIKSKQNSQTGKISPYSREFWTSKINPNTGNYYTEEESDYERNSRRPIRKEYWIKKGYSIEESEILAIESKNKNNIKGSEKVKKLNPEIHKIFSKRCIEYWTNKGYSEKDAIEKVSQHQTTFSLKICIEKYGEEIGRQRWLDRQNKWHKSYKKSNFSKISQQLFWDICSKLDFLDFIYFAELGIDKNPDYSGINNEYRLKLNRVFLPDFIDIENKKIIEFDGIYWHGKVGRGNKKRDDEKIKSYIMSGYSVLSICEKEYKNDKNGVIEKCLNFLKK